MKQLLQRLDDGTTEIIEVPIPKIAGCNVLVETRATVISAGTERMIVEFGKSNLIEKARSQPDKVRQVVDKIRTEGLAPTLEAVRAKLDAPIPLGYCHAGVVVDVGASVRNQLRAGDRVVTNGAHGEFAAVPITLTAKIPDNVDFETAAFTPLAAIGLQGIRLAEPTLGETVVVFGLGLIGLMTVQLLRANGCRVIGIDTDASRLRLAEQFGAIAVSAGEGNVVDRVLAETRGMGADAVLMTLASHSNEPIRQAAAMSRKRGRIILVGVTGLELSRDEFFKKELHFAVSCSYGPGRYDPTYEQKGNDYPFGFVRWTEQRNFEAVLALMSAGALNVEPLITHRFAFTDAPEAYDLISSPAPSLGIVLAYGQTKNETSSTDARTVRLVQSTASMQPVIGVIGAGNFATRTLLPILKKSQVHLKGIASSGASSALAGRKFGFEFATSDVDTIIEDPQIDAVCVLTRHNSHAPLAVKALEAGKHVFVEKPLALSISELDQIERAARKSGKSVMVGFNRRFAPHAEEVQRGLKGRAGPVSIVATVNAGFIPADHWTQDLEVGGGRIVGEACHWIDLARFLVGAPIVNAFASTAASKDGTPIEDIAHLVIEFADGSTAAVHYLANGARSFPKERIECFFDGRTFVIENWRRLLRFGGRTGLFNFKRAVDKGHERQIEAWVAGLAADGDAPIPLSEILEVSRWSIAVAEQARQLRSAK